MNVLFLGDVVGNKGREVVKRLLPRLKAEYSIDYVIANGENAAGGNGITRTIADEMFDAGVDVITGGNHIWDQKEILSFIDEYPRIIRPLNYPPGTPGQGVFVTELGSPPRPLVVVSLMGRTFMPPVDCPFRAFDALESELPPNAVVVVDFHAEATSEKKAFGYYVDGRATAVVGTHTHVATADERVLPRGTAYISDVGMCGPYESVIGVETDLVLRRFLTGLPTRFTVASGPGILSAVVLRVNSDPGGPSAPERISRLVSESR